MARDPRSPTPERPARKKRTAGAKPSRKHAPDDPPVAEKTDAEAAPAEPKTRTRKGRRRAAPEPVPEHDEERAAPRTTLTAPRAAELDGLVSGEPMVKIDSLRSGYGPMEILHGFSLHVGAGQSLCLIGPNGAGKSTVLHSIFGFARIMSGTVWVDGRDVTRLAPSDKLRSAGIAYVLQDNSVFPDMTVEENLWLGGYLKPNKVAARDAAEWVFSKYRRLADRRRQPARVLSGGERRLLEISRALVMDPKVLLVDEPSIGLEPRYIDMVFEILADLRDTEKKTIIMVEQNAKKGLEHANIGYVLTSGQLAKAGTGAALLADPEIGSLFLGG